MLSLIVREVDHALLFACGCIKYGQDWLLIRDDEITGCILISYPGATRGHQVCPGHREEVVLSEAPQQALLGLLVREVVRGQEVVQGGAVRDKGDLPEADRGVPADRQEDVLVRVDPEVPDGLRAMR